MSAKRVVCSEAARIREPGALRRSNSADGFAVAGVELLLLV